MNRRLMDNSRLPKFLEGVELPESYFLPQDPYADAPSCNMDLGAFAKYARSLDKLPAEVTRVEFEEFQRIEGLLWADIFPDRKGSNPEDTQK